MKNKIWFSAKKYGWGWGLPMTWEGWMVLIAYIFVTLFLVSWHPPSRSIGKFLLATVLPTVVLIAICYFKGEKPRWRWGDDSWK